MPRGRKRAVSSEKMKEWLRLAEVEGKSAPEIGKMESDRYDPRTVRKYLELARQERETTEARAQVLRNALESHYKVLVSFANDIDKSIVASTVPVPEKTDRKWAALRHHLPRSPIPKAIDRWERLHQEIVAIEAGALARLNDAVAEGPFKYREKGKAVGLDLEGLSTAVKTRLRSPASPRGAQQPIDEPRTELAGDGIARVFLGDRACAVVPLRQETEAAEFLRSLIAGVSRWPERESMQKALAELEELTADLREELATIMLRGILPGRCKYCPI